MRSTDAGVGRTGKVKSDIDVTALVGVLVVLLTIQMISVPIHVGGGGGVRLPDAVNTVNKPNPDCRELTVVAIAADRSIYVNCKPIREEELAAKVSESLESKKDKTILIEAADNAPYSAIMAAMDSLRAVQIANVSLIVEKRANRQ